jgi:hypothetical protein
MAASERIFQVLDTPAAPSEHGAAASARRGAPRRSGRPAPRRASA